MTLPRPSFFALPAATLLFAVMLPFGAFAVLAGCAEEQAQTAEEMTQEAPPPAAEDAPMNDPIAEGRALYATHCMSCHGPGGEGDGDLVGDLNVLPGDLTQLSSNNGGTYPVDEVVSVIDGTKEVAIHETREMPIWGNIWREDDGGPVSDEVVQRKINALVEYLRSIQDKS